MVAAPVLSTALRPTQKIADEESRTDIETMIPKQFGQWREVNEGQIIAIDPQQAEVLHKIYSQTLSRTYGNAAGDRVMLSIAYGGDQSDGMQVHRPEVCYPAQGFHVMNQSDGTMDIDQRHLPVRHLVAAQGLRVEPITYWIVVGDKVALSAWGRKLAQLRYGLSGRVPDGMLIRVSSISSREEGAYELQATFLRSLVAVLDPKLKNRLLGTPE
jgi:EpsI family protein